MADGFEVIPDELERAAGRISEALGDVARMAWREPGDDYGHPTVTTAWSHFLEEFKDQVDALHDVAVDHGANLRAAATHYRELDIANSYAVGNCWLPDGSLGRGVQQVGQSRDDSGIPGGGFAGGVAGVGDAPAKEPTWVNPGWALRLGDSRDADEGIHH